MKRSSLLQRRITTLGRKLGSPATGGHLARLASREVLLDLWFVIPVGSDDENGSSVRSDIEDRLRHFGSVEPKNALAIASVLFATSTTNRSKSQAPFQSEIDLVAEKLNRSAQLRGRHFSQVAGAVASGSGTSLLEIRMEPRLIDDARWSIYEYLKALAPRRGINELTVSTIWTAPATPKK